MDDNVEDCPVCLMAYDDTLGRPRNLPCGHTFCTRCVNGCMEQGLVTCPTCRTEHALPETGQFPVSYAVEALIKRLRSVASTFLPPNAGENTGEPARSTIGRHERNMRAGLSKAICSILQGQEAKVWAAINTCKEVREQLHQYQATLTDWYEQQQQLQERLQALMDQTENATVFMQLEHSHVADENEQMQEREQHLRALVPALHAATTPHEAYDVIDNADHTIDEVMPKVEACQKMFPNMQAVITISKARAASSAALEAATNIQEALETEGAPAGAAEDSDPPTAPDLSIKDRLEALLEPTMKFEDLRSLAQHTRKMLQAGLVFTSYLVEGRKLHGRIGLENNRLYLHSLQDQSPPPFAVTVQMDEVVLPCPPCLVFLDLAWPGTARRRVLVRLSPDTPLGRQFMLLCTGERGPCYTNTKLFHVVNKGKPGEWVVGGAYDTNDGSGGPALLDNLDKGIYRSSGKAGAVFRTVRSSNSSDWNAQFGMITREREDNAVYHGVFGEVEEGLNVLVAAAKHTPIKEVTVVNCGVVL